MRSTALILEDQLEIAELLAVNIQHASDAPRGCQRNTVPLTWSDGRHLNMTRNPVRNRIAVIAIEGLPERRQPRRRFSVGLVTTYTRAFQNAATYANDWNGRSVRWEPRPRIGAVMHLDQDNDGLGPKAET
jgi:hypothetical protein